ncbi:MAG TPA: alpha/beta hydrolase, partial [Gemmatirosa sp.]
SRDTVPTARGGGHIRRRDVLRAGAVAGVALVGGAVLGAAAVERRPAPVGSRDAFAAAQGRLLARYGVQARERYVTLGAPPLRTHVLEAGPEAGAGEPVLLLHGGGSVAAEMTPLLAALQPRFHVYAPDRPGCGLTDMVDYTVVAPTIAAFRAHAVAFVGAVLDALGLATASLVANSMGGYWALAFALAHPERVRRLVLVGEPAGSAEHAPLMQRLLGVPAVSQLLRATALRPTPDHIRESYARILVAHVDRVPQELLDCAYAAAVLPGAQRAWYSMLDQVTHVRGASELTYALRPELPRLAVPTLFVWGDRDTFGSSAEGQAMSRLMPNGRAEVIADAGHLVWLDQPARCAELVTGFLAAAA